MTTYSKMVCLVGENPLPIWLGIQQFMPSFKETERQESRAKVILVYSDQTKEAAQHLYEQLDEERKRGLHEIECVFDARGNVQNAFAPASMRSTLDKMNALDDLAEYALNYTGGTKVMSAYFFYEWMSKGRGERAFYLEETSGQFHCDQGKPYRLEPRLDQLSLETLERLHGANPVSLRNEVPCTLDECLKFFHGHLDHSLDTVRGKLTGIGDDKGIQSFFEKQAERTGGWKKGGEWDIVLSYLSEPIRLQWQAIPLYTNDVDKTFNEELREQFRFAVKNEWMEWLVMLLLRDILSRSEIVAGKKFKIEGQEFEADVLAVCKNRLYYFSVTTKSKPDECKEKMFEAIHRSRQLGGGLARSCTICLADTFDDPETGTKSDTIPVIRKSLTGSDKVGNHTIFGRNHVKQWLDDGYAKDLDDFINQ